MGSEILRTRLFRTAALVGALAACTVPAPVLEDRACDGTHPCKPEYSCVLGRCVVDGQGDGGTGAPDGGAEACTGTGTRPCGSSVGECKPGTQTCLASGLWGPCTGGNGPGTEICDGKDNDCNGETDEEQNLKSTPCELQKGVCAGSHKDCFGGVEDPCDALTYSNDYEPGTETSCDGLDNDCDGKTDEGLDNDGDGWGVDVTCVNGSGDCDDWNPTVSPVADELCNGRDDDCNGKTDDGGGRICVMLETGLVCDEADAGTVLGVETCNALCSAWECKPPAEVCNGVDDDQDGSPDEDLAGAWARLDLAGAKPDSPRVAGFPGMGFIAAWRAVGAAGEVKVSRMLSPELKAEAPVPAASGAIGAVAVTASHLFWLQASGVGAKALHRGLPAGSAVAAAATSSAPAHLAALDWDPAAGKSMVAVAAGANVKVVTLTGRTPLVRSSDTLGADAGPTGGLALARLGAIDALLVFQAQTALKAVIVGPGVSDWGTAYAWSPSSGLSSADSPAGAGGAVAFHGRDGAKHVIAVGRALDHQLAAGEWATVSMGTDPTSQPALAALSDTEYLVAWIEAPATGTLVNTKRIRWNGAAWSTPSSATGLKNKDDDAAAVLAASAGTDGVRYLVLFHTLGTTDDLVARTNCPAGL